MSCPTECYLVTSRSDVFAPEKAVAFELSEQSARRSQVHFESMNGFPLHVEKCVIMTEQTFQELCPDWDSGCSTSVRISTDNESQDAVDTN